MDTESSVDGTLKGSDADDEEGTDEGSIEIIGFQEEEEDEGGEEDVVSSWLTHSQEEETRFMARKVGNLYYVLTSGDLWKIHGQREYIISFLKWTKTL